MESSKEAISVRVGKLNSQIMGKVKTDNANLLTREGLLDALQVLYDECNTECIKNLDKNISLFVEKHKKTVTELKRLRVNISDFEVKNVIGRGNFGEVHVVKEKQTGDIYAMKTIKKHQSLEEKNVAFQEERNIMAFGNSLWLTSLQYAFQDKNNLYFVMEYHPGGDLLGLLYRQGGTLPESAATFYLAEMILALNDLHNMGYIHRDIKPDNILLDRCGHLKLADFGSAARLIKSGMLVNGIPVGTPDYIAPEVLQSMDNKNSKSAGYGVSCDFWSLGIIAYELTIGNTPFAGNNATAIYGKIMNHKNHLKFPPDIILSQAYVSIIKGLITDQTSRLKSSQLLDHVLFKDLDFNELREQVPPFVPKITSVDDTSNFSDIQVKKNQPHIDNFKRKTQFSGKNLPFIGFTYSQDVQDYKERYSSNIIQDSTVGSLRTEIDSLQWKLMKNNDVISKKDSIEKKLEEKTRKLVSVESVRNSLEKSLASTMAECSALKRTLELERKERADLEKKALDLIKSAKIKWEASERTKVAALTLELDQLKDDITRISEENTTLTKHLQLAEQIRENHQVSLDKVEELNRRSVVGLESKIEKLTSEAHSQIVTLENQLKNEISVKAETQKQLNNMKKMTNELQNKLENKEKQCGNVSSDLIITKKNLVDLENKLDEIKKDNIKLENKCSESNHDQEVIKSLNEEIKLITDEKQSLKTNFMRVTEHIKKLKTEIDTWKEQLHTTCQKFNKSLEEKTKSHKESLAKLQEEIKNSNKHNDYLELKLQEARAAYESNKGKVKCLEDLLARLESGITKLENSSERENVLHEQVDRLEKQIAELHENAALEKQELLQTKSKLWRCEKELTNSDLDKKIVERDLKDMEIENKKLQSDIENLQLQLKENNEQHENAFKELNDMNEELSNKIIKLIDLNGNLQKKLASNENESQDNQKVIAELRNRIEVKENNAHEINALLLAAENEKAKLIRRLGKQELDMENLIQELDMVKNERKNDIVARENYKIDLQNSQKTINDLRDACTLLENQLIDFEKIQVAHETKEKSFMCSIKQLESELSETKYNLQEAKKLVNEEKSLKLLTENKYKKNSEETENLQKELKTYINRCEEFKEYSNGLCHDLTRAEEKIAENESTIKLFERDFDNLISENNMLKEENSTQLTYVNNVKESNFKLNQKLSDTKNKNDVLIEKLNELENDYLEKINYYKERELKSQSTILQQTKLIDFLQIKTEEASKKKRTFSDKLFGHSKKENQPPTIVLNYKDLEMELKKEKESNRDLRQEIIKLKTESCPRFDMSSSRSKVETIQSEEQKKILQQLVQSPNAQKNELYRHNSIQRMRHNIPHRFESKLSTKLIKCYQCANQISLGKNISTCQECNIVVHASCVKEVPRTCGLPRAYARHYTDSVRRVLNVSKEENKSKENLEGWVKLPVRENNCWEKYYAQLTPLALKIYADKPNSNSVSINQLDLVSTDTYGKVTMEPLPSEIGVPVANSDLPFILKIEVSPNSMCWPPKCIIFMALCAEDKEKWYNAINSILKPMQKYVGQKILEVDEDFDVNCLFELSKETRVLGTDKGLYSCTHGKILHISGLNKVHQISLLTSNHLILMIVDTNRILIKCDSRHLTNLTECAPCVNPTLKYSLVNVSNLNGFHIFEVSDLAKSPMLCVATSKQLIIMMYDLTVQDFKPLRILDTAEPTSCILFTEHSLIIGANKFFEVDLVNFEADEFLDASDLALTHAIKCSSIGSFPLAIQQISKNPAEFLVCFKEFATFVDEFGRSSRNNDLKWNHLPLAFHYNGPYLYVVHFTAVEIFCIRPNSDKTSFKISLSGLRFLGAGKKGIYLKVGKEVKYFEASVMDCDNISLSTMQSDQSEGSRESDRFSFTSSIMQSLDGNLSDIDMEDSDDTSNNLKHETTRKVKFTDL